MRGGRVNSDAERMCCKSPVVDESPRAVPHRYRIRVRGQLDPSWADTLGGLELTWDDHDNTVLIGDLLDQAALRGVLTRLFDLGSLLLSVTKEPRP
jgi:hypothetical protein